MSRKPKDNRPYIRPVTRIELSEKNIKQRWILIIVLLVIAVVAIGYGVSQMLDVQPGWNPVEAAATAPNYSSEFSLMYDFSRFGGDAAAANKQLTNLYTNAMEDAYRIFSKDAEGEEQGNLYTLNRNPNKPVSVHPELYRVLENLQQYDNRCIYLAPVYVEYNRVFNAESDAGAMLYDPAVNEETAEYISQLIRYISDDSMISMELLMNDQVQLNVAPEYLSFAEEYGIEEFLDLGWMRNAFVCDYIAEQMVQQGFTHGYLASYDGFTRNLDGSGQKFESNVYDRQGTDIYVPGKFAYSGPMTIVFLRDYPLSALDNWSYHVYADGRLVHSMIDPMTGVCTGAVDTVLCYGRDTTCAEVLLNLIPVYMKDQLQVEQLLQLKEQGIDTVWCEGSTVCYTDADLDLTLLENADGVIYGQTHIK